MPYRSASAASLSLFIVGLKYIFAVLHAAPVSHGKYANGTDRQTDRQTDARPLNYAFCYMQPV